jgi:hypothetical protein
LSDRKQQTAFENLKQASTQAADELIYNDILPGADSGNANSAARCCK